MPGIITEPLYYFIHEVHLPECWWPSPCFHRSDLYNQEEMNYSRALVVCAHALCITESLGYTENDLLVAILRFGTIL